MLTHLDLKKYTKFTDHLKSEGRIFTSTKTNYTKRVLVEETGETFMFVENPKEERKLIYLLPLINKVKKDAKEYLNSSDFVEIDKSSLSYFKLIRKIPVVGAKIDIKSAYWEAAMKMGIISEETNDYFLRTTKDLTVKQRKSVRTKALGSIATRKVIETWIGNEMVGESFKTEKTRPVYFSIIDKIDGIMSDSFNKSMDGFYYYVDCIMSTNPKEIEDIIRSEGYSVTSEYAEFGVKRIGKAIYLHERTADKSYYIEMEAIKNIYL